ncbi:MAG: hypothetical protein IT494_02670 [Gammaproteobacteria bacterium]|nr:hypothetical protein [Gammaproteobacteria bacterium]
MASLCAARSRPLDYQVEMRPAEYTSIMIALHTEDTLPWRALITRAEAEIALVLPQHVEDYLCRTLLLYLGRPNRLSGAKRAAAIDALFAQASQDPRLIGDRSLLLVGFFPEQVTRMQVPVNSLIEYGRLALRTSARRDDEPLLLDVEREFLRIVDVLRMMRHLTEAARAPDLLNLYQFWLDTRSTYAWQLLRTELAGLPAATGSRLRH